MSETAPEASSQPEADVDAAPAPLDTTDPAVDGTAEQGTEDTSSLPPETPVAPGQVDGEIETGQQENPMAGENSEPEVPAEAQQPGALDSPTISTPLVETGPGPQDEQIPDDVPAPHAPFDPSGRPDPELAPGGHS